MADPVFSNEFLDLFTQHQLRLYRYIVTVIADCVEAEDVLQNVNLVLLRKWDQFRWGADFWKWAVGIARLEILEHRAGKSTKAARHGLTDATIEMLAAEVAEEFSILEQRNAALPGCMDKLSRGDLELVTDHYFRGLSWKTIAGRLGRAPTPCAIRFVEFDGS